MSEINQHDLKQAYSSNDQRDLNFLFQVKEVITFRFAQIELFAETLKGRIYEATASDFFIARECKDLFITIAGH